MTWITLRVTSDEKMRLMDDADAAGVTLSRLVRNRALARPVIAHANAAMIKELRRHGTLLKQVHAESGGVHATNIAAAIQSIQIFIDRLAAPKDGP